VVPPPCRGPAALAIRAVSRPFLAQVPGREVAGVRVISVFLFFLGRRAQKRPRSPRTRAAEWRRGARLPPRTDARPVVPPPCRGPAALALGAVSRPFLARVLGREIAGVRVISVFPFFLRRWEQKRPRSPRTRAAERRRGARLPPRTDTRPVVPPPCRGPAALALRAVSRPFLARVPGREGFSDS
jgi:hypothetical protein